MKAWNCGWLVPALLLGAACGRDPEPVELRQPAAAEPQVTAATRQAALQDMLQTGIGGEVHATPHADRVELHVAVTDGVPESTLAARVQSGTCENPGAELAVLEAVRTGQLGNGQSASAVAHPPERVMDGNHIVALYAPGTAPAGGRPVACASIPTR